MKHDEMETSQLVELIAKGEGVVVGGRSASTLDELEFALQARGDVLPVRIALTEDEWEDRVASAVGAISTRLSDALDALDAASAEIADLKAAAEVAKLRTATPAEGEQQLALDPAPPTSKKGS